MKMVKSLLLGSAAGLVAVAGAQAADLPVKAKPVEYVKICSVYGVGFFYIPGTDTCIKIGGWVRAEALFNAGGSHAQYYSGGAGRNDHIDTADVQFRNRFVTSFDVRTQTEYGTMRAYTRAGFQWTTNDDGIGSYYVERAFIQFAGFTFGRSQSYFDFYANVFYYTGFIGGPSSTGAAGNQLFAYTAQFGNGFTATVSVEDATIRRNAIWDAGDPSLNAALTIGSMPGPSQQVATGYEGRAGVLLPTGTGGGLVTGGGGVNIGDYAAAQVPDIVGALRVDQAWGSAQVAGALHQVRAGNYGVNTTGASSGCVAALGNCVIGPADKWGFAAMAGVVVNLPWLAQGDQFWVEGAYTVGAPAYTGFNTNGQYNTFQRFNGSNVAAAWALDAVFGPLGTGLELTTVWAIAAGIQHYWTPALRTSWFGIWNTADFNGTATGFFCNNGAQSPYRTLTGATGASVGGIVGCNPDFNVWAVGTRTIWNPVPNLDMGLEVVYAKIETKSDPATTRLNFGGAGGRAPGLYAPSNEAVWSGIFRWQRNFWP
jgi:Porin subfamily